jgi:uncharacterized protein DUF1579
MRRRIPMILAALALLLCTTIVSAQAPPAPPKPGPEVKAMGAMVGAWNASYDMKPSPDMPKGGKATSGRTCAWTAGGFGVSCTESMNMAGIGKVTSVNLMFYDPEAKNYIYSEVSTTGEAFTVRGVNNGDTWVFDNDATMQGKPMHTRFTVKYTSKNACDIKFEAGADANSMQVVMTGMETKKAAAPATAKPTTK